MRRSTYAVSRNYIFRCGFTIRGGGGDDGPCPNLMSTDMTNGPLLFSILFLTFEMCSVRLADADEQLFVCVPSGRKFFVERGWIR